MKRIVEDQTVEQHGDKKAKVYPLDQHRKFLGSYEDKDGYTHKQYELTAALDETDKIQIELVIKDPNHLEILNEEEKRINAEKAREAAMPVHAHISHTRVFGRTSLSKRFRSLLEDTKIAEVSLSDKNVVFASENDSIGDVFTNLVKNNILSVPVYSGEMRLVGFLDILDILHFLSERVVDYSKGGPFDSIGWFASWHSVQAVKDVKCKDIINISQRNPNLSAQHDLSVQLTLDSMGAYNLHRIAIVKGDTLVGILTQTKLLDFFFKHNFLEDIGNIAKMTAGQMQLGYKKVFTTTTSTKAIDAFRFMIENQVSGLAVLNDEGQIVGNISASDIRELGFEFNLFSKLFVSIKDFFGENAKPLQAVNPETTFKKIVEIFHTSKVHRVYVVEGKDILGVITPSDILKCFQTKPHVIRLELMTNY